MQLVYIPLPFADEAIAVYEGSIVITVTSSWLVASVNSRHLSVDAMVSKDLMRP
jgi:hypothetical protein